MVEGRYNLGRTLKVTIHGIPIEPITPIHKKRLEIKNRSRSTLHPSLPLTSQDVYLTRVSYQLLKAFHLIFLVSWFAGLFYIFRLFVYHAQSWEDSRIRSVFITMERKLLKYIMLPAALGSTAMGLLLLKSNPGLINSTWIWVKFGLVILLYSYHALAWWVYLRMSLGHKVFSEKACRTINEFPTIVLIAISILVFLKPTF